MTAPRWPELPLSEWQGTRDALHLWSQVVGKTKLGLVPPLNHSWGVALLVNARGLTTGLMPGGLELAFDLVDHELVLTTTQGERRTMPLRAESVADFYGRYIQLLGDLAVPIDTTPTEMVDVTPFEDDREPRPYDPEAVRRFWTALVAMTEVFAQFRAEYRGKASPVHFFWGAFDLAVTRFSGRPAPQHPGGVPNCPDRVMHDAYDSELSSAGYWPGPDGEGVFYSYAYPEPDGYRDTDLGVPGARFDAALGEFVLPYAAVRTSDDPDAVLLAFLRSSFEAAARTAGWPGEVS
ncbi:DUF5996 family protein [Jatrophihabitans fulvus]